jgi:hypothetical protein
MTPENGVFYGAAPSLPMLEMVPGWRYVAAMTGVPLSVRAVVGGVIYGEAP